MLPLLSLASSLPHLPLGVRRSPVEQHPALASALGAETLLVQRDDLSGAEFGGNKLRALEFLLPVAGRYPITMGGYGSTWCAALARVIARQGGRASVALFPQPWTPAVAGVLATSLRHGDVALAGSRFGMPRALLRAIRTARQRGAARWVSPGGADAAGVLGSVNAALEFVEQVEQEGWTQPEAIILPLGSGGTAAGLYLGFRMAGWKTDLIAVRVADRWIANQWQVHRLAGKAAGILRRHGIVIPDGQVSLRVIGDQLGGGYGHPTPAGQTTGERFALSGMTLDPTYSAKAAAALTQSASRYRHLGFWHTFDARLISSAPMEHPLLQRAQAHAESLWRHPKSI